MENQFDLAAYKLAEQRAREECGQLIEQMSNSVSTANTDDMDNQLYELSQSIAKLFYLKSKTHELVIKCNSHEDALDKLGLRR